MSTATNIINDGSAAGTTVLEATVGAESVSSVKLTNDAKFTLGSVNHSGSMSLDNGKVTTDGSGNLTVQNLTTTGDVTTGNDTVLTYGTGNKIGSNQMSCFVSGQFTASGSTSTVNHGMTVATPKIVFVFVINASTLTNKRVSSITSTQFVCNNTTNGLNYGFLALA